MIDTAPADHKLAISQAASWQASITSINILSYEYKELLQYERNFETILVGAMMPCGPAG